MPGRKFALETSKFPALGLFSMYAVQQDLAGPKNQLYE